MKKQIAELEKEISDRKSAASPETACGEITKSLSGVVDPLESAAHADNDWASSSSGGGGCCTVA